MANTKWSDQPARLADAESIAEIALRNARHAQILRVPLGTRVEWYVTIGNLFGSQTVQVPDLEHAIRLIDSVSHTGDDEVVDLTAHRAVMVEA